MNDVFLMSKPHFPGDDPAAGKKEPDDQSDGERRADAVPPQRPDSCIFLKLPRVSFTEETLTNASGNAAIIR